MSFKLKVYNECLKILNHKISDLDSALNTITESANNETKSTAGDKHETARAMMQLEQEKLSKQLREAREQKTELEKINITIQSSTIIKGSLISTGKAYIFIGPGLGKIQVDKESVIAISPVSPLGKRLLGAKLNDSVEMNGITYSIKALY